MRGPGSVLKQVFIFYIVIVVIINIIIIIVFKKKFSQFFSRLDHHVLFRSYSSNPPLFFVFFTQWQWQCPLSGKDLNELIYTVKVF